MKTTLIITTAVLHIVIGQKFIIDDQFEAINADFVKYNRIAAEIAWDSSLHPGNPELPKKATNYQKKLIKWQHQTCDRLAALRNNHLLNDTQRRQTYLLCRGPVYTFEEARKTSDLYEELQSMYSNVKICLPTNKRISTQNTTEIETAILNYITSVKHFLNLEIGSYGNDSVAFAAKLAVDGDFQKNEDFCLNGESGFDKLMGGIRNEVVLRWLWLVWREKVVVNMKEPYDRLLAIENNASRRNGYSDIGSAWREELETPGLRTICRHLFSSIRPLYRLLHGVVRFYLRKEYGDLVPRKGLIPAHLLGSLWSQNWERIIKLIVPNNINIDESIKQKNWTVQHMVRRAEDFYQSMGLPTMTDIFWRESVFMRENYDGIRCHGAAADMYKSNDFRLLYCSGITSEDYYVIHHEMGHIQYYMAYEKQPGIFRQGTNSAFHESIGDAIMFGVMTPQHLHRLGLINDTILFTTQTFDNSGDDEEISEGSNIPYYKRKPKHKHFKRNGQVTERNMNEVKFTSDDILLLIQSLNKIPQIPFALIIEEYRWKYFEGGIRKGEENEIFWKLAREVQGISPVGERGEKYFDIGAKYHVPDNTPYIRYFLSSFLQHQLFESLCKASVYGRTGVKEDIPMSISVHRCDIYGSKAAGKLLKDIMSRGSSQHWREILQSTTGFDDISAASLKRYYRPLYKLLTTLVRAHSIPLGW